MSKRFSFIFSCILCSIVIIKALYTQVYLQLEDGRLKRLKVGVKEGGVILNNFIWLRHPNGSAGD